MYKGRLYYIIYCYVPPDAILEQRRDTYSISLRLISCLDLTQTSFLLYSFMCAGTFINHNHNKRLVKTSVTSVIKGRVMTSNRVRMRVHITTISAEFSLVLY